MGWEQGHVWWDPPTLHWSQKRRCSLGHQILTAKDEAMCYTCEVELHLQRISTLYYCCHQKSSWIEVWFNTQFHSISGQFLQRNWVWEPMWKLLKMVSNGTFLVMSKSSNHMVKPCLQVAKDLSGEQQMHLLISPPLCLLLVMRLPHNYFRTASKWDCCTRRRKKENDPTTTTACLSRMCHCSSLDALFTALSKLQDACFRTQTQKEESKQ